LIPARTRFSSNFGFFDEIRDFGVPVVVMTDDDGRATAMDLVQRGVYNYIRKPPACRN
jgi:DNA-binding NtrC family response regulator